MGPTNVALTKLFTADKALREAKNNLAGASSSVRSLERRLSELQEKAAASSDHLRQQQSLYAQLDLDIKSREEHIEKLRAQQQNCVNHKEYQAFLTDINTAKIDKAKVEDEAIRVMEKVETAQKELADLKAQIEGESKKLEETRTKLGGKLAELQAVIDSLQPPRDEAAKDVSAKALAMFDRLCDRYEGEALAPITRPDKRVEEYACGSCFMGLVVNVYNKLHTRDDIVACPSCGRLLFIPEDLTIEAAIIKRERRERRAPDDTLVIATGRQVSAIDIMKSITPDPDEPTDEPVAPEQPQTPTPENPA